MTSRNKYSGNYRVNPVDISKVSNFSAASEFGSVLFDGLVDLRDINLEEEIVFTKGSLEIYPNKADMDKPNVGSGLNRPATITLLVEPKLGKTAAAFAEKLRASCVSSGSEYISYDGVKCEWKFRVLHFSKYALVDSDDESDTVVPPGTANQTPVNASTQLSTITTVARTSFATNSSAKDGQVSTTTTTLPLKRPDVALSAAANHKPTNIAICSSSISSSSSDSISGSVAASVRPAAAKQHMSSSSFSSSSSTYNTSSSSTATPVQPAKRSGGSISGFKSVLSKNDQENHALDFERSLKAVLKLKHFNTECVSVGSLQNGNIFLYTDPADLSNSVHAFMRAEIKVRDSSAAEFILVSPTKFSRNKLTDLYRHYTVPVLVEAISPKIRNVIKQEFQLAYCAFVDRGKRKL